MYRQDLDETKLSDIGSINSHKKLKSVLKRQHGVDLGDPKHGEGGGNYRTHHDATITDGKGGKKPFGGARPLKTVHKGGAKNDEIKGRTTGDQIRQMVGDSGRVNKTPEAVKRRKDEAKANLAAKQKRRAAPFGKKSDGTTTKKRTYENFMNNCDDLLTEGEFSVMIDE
jgi:hypothetical protein